VVLDTLGGNGNDDDGDFEEGYECVVEGEVSIQGVNPVVVQLRISHPEKWRKRRRIGR